MLELFTRFTGVMCTMTRRTFKFRGNVERCCHFTLEGYFSARPDNSFTDVTLSQPGIEPRRDQLKSNKLLDI